MDELEQMLADIDAFRDSPEPLWLRADRVEPVLTALLNQNAALRASLEETEAVLDNLLGDSDDIPDDWTDEDICREEPLMWACMKISAVLSQPAPPELERLRRIEAEAKCLVEMKSDLGGVRGMAAAMNEGTMDRLWADLEAALTGGE